ncbi:MAG: hypothetical protein COC01_03290 [Bacteroidetes bacterium]|nr:MAG: hypothetical protein COC01_03290 [Bacteroidota bacterium]
MKKILVILIVFINCNLLAQNTFQKIYWGLGAVSVKHIPTFDRGYLLSGSMYYQDIYKGLLAVKTDSSGNVQWSKIYARPLKQDDLLSVKQTSDSGFVLLGEFIGPFLIKTDVNGDTLWTITFGSNLNNGFSEIEETSDKGLIILTRVNQAGNYVPLLIKLDSNGSIEWTMTYESSGFDQGYSIDQLSDNGFIITGRHISGTDENILAIRTDSIGNIIWANQYGGTGGDEGYAVKQTTDGGFIITGWADELGTGNNDAVLLKLHGNGEMAWLKIYGGVKKGHDVVQDPYGNIAFTGYRGSPTYDIFFIKTDSVGNIQSSRTYGEGHGRSIHNTDDEGFSIAAYGNKAGYDGTLYLIKINSSGFSGNCFDNSYSPSVSIPDTAFFTEQAVSLTTGTYDSVIYVATEVIDTIVFAQDMNIFSEVTTEQIFCNGASDGTASVSTWGGLIPLNYSWTGGATAESISSLSPGVYYVNITDAYGYCSVQDTGVIIEPDTISSQLYLEHNLCFGDNSGSASISVAGGTVPYEYHWSDGSTSQGLTSLFADSYTITVIDVNDCPPHIVDFTIDEQPKLSTSISSSGISCPSGTNGRADLTVSGGVVPYNYEWSDFTQLQDNDSLSSGTHTVSVIDFYKCTIIDTVTIPEMTLDISPDTTIYCGASAPLFAVSNDTNATFSWSPTSSLDSSNSSQPVATPYKNTTYNVAAMSGSCIMNASVTVNVEIMSHFSYVIDGMTVNFKMKDTICTKNGFKWDYGNGMTSTIAKEPFVTYLNEGTYTSCLQCNSDPQECITCVNITVPSNDSGSTFGSIADYQILQENIFIYPNPNNGSFNIVFPLNMNSDIYLRIFDQLGRNIYQNKINHTSVLKPYELTIPNPSKGMYFIQITDGDYMILKKMILTGK